MTSEELATAGVPPTEENAPPSKNDLIAEAIRDPGIHEDGEIRSENRSGGDEDLSNIEVDLNELVAAKATSYPPTFLFGKSKVTAELIQEYEKAGFFPASDGCPLLVKRSLLLKPMKLLFSGISLPMDLDFLVILIYLLFLRSFL
jgi:hypothetical protein